MHSTNRFGASLALLGVGVGLARADVVGVNYSTGAVFSISTNDATATRIGQTATGIMGVDRDAHGSLLAITDGIAGKLAFLDQQRWQLDAVGNLNAGFTFEGGLAAGPGGELYAGTRLSGTGRAVFQIDPQTGRMGRSITLSRPEIDLNGLQFRDDGVLVAIDAAAGDLVAIDTETGEVRSIASLLTPAAGAVGGLAIDNGMGFYVTAGTTSGSGGDNSLYSIDLYSGAQTHIGTLGAEAGSGFGIGALVGPAVPSPAATLLLSWAGGLAVARRPRRSPAGDALTRSPAASAADSPTAQTDPDPTRR